jgi:hypothetical protein
MPSIKINVSYFTDVENKNTEKLPERTEAVDSDFLELLGNLNLASVKFSGIHAFPNELASEFRDSETLRSFHMDDEYFTDMDKIAENCDFPAVFDFRYENTTNYTLDMKSVPGLTVRHKISAVAKWKNTIRFLSLRGLDSTYEEYEKLVESGVFENVLILDISMFRPLSMYHDEKGKMPDGKPRSTHLEFLADGALGMFTEEEKADGKLAEEIGRKLETVIINYEQMRFMALFPNLNVLFAKRSWFRRLSSIKRIFEPFRKTLRYLNMSTDLTVFDQAMDTYDRSVITENVRTNVFPEIGKTYIKDITFFSEFPELRHLILDNCDVENGYKLPPKIEFFSCERTNLHSASTDEKASREVRDFIIRCHRVAQQQQQIRQLLAPGGMSDQKFVNLREFCSYSQNVHHEKSEKLYKKIKSIVQEKLANIDDETRKHINNESEKHIDKYNFRVLLNRYIQNPHHYKDNPNLEYRKVFAYLYLIEKEDIKDKVVLEEHESIEKVRETLFETLGKYMRDMYDMTRGSECTPGQVIKIYTVLSPLLGLFFDNCIVESRMDYISDCIKEAKSYDEFMKALSVKNIVLSKTEEENWLEAKCEMDPVFESTIPGGSLSNLKTTMMNINGVDIDLDDL